MSTPLNERINRSLFSTLIQESNIFGDNENASGNIIDIADEVLDLRSLPSEDSRFKDAYQDAIQHLVNNDDWSWEYFFIDRLKLAEDNNNFLRFLEAIVSPKYRAGEDDIIKFVMLINPYLEQSGLELALDNYDEKTDWPVYKIRDRQASSVPPDLKKNDIPIIIYSDITRNSHRLASHKKPTTLPSLVLVFNTGWNDYGYRTSFDLFYYDDVGNGHVAGSVKIAIEDAKSLNMETPIIMHLDKRYESHLPDNFCSLGQDETYYSNLKTLLDRKFESVLYALRDVAFFSDIREKFENNGVYRTSLIRYENSERIARQVKLKIYGGDSRNLYKFNYAFQPAYADGSVDVRFEFSNEGALPSRIYALIGKNGTGKTQFITNLPLDIWKKRDEKFIPKAPLFSKVIAVSYSVFDNFPVPRKTSSFNYVYCGLKNESGELMTDRGQVLRFHNTWKRIESSERIDQWRSVLLNFLDESLLNELFIKKEDKGGSKNSYTVNASNLTQFRSKLSSGQNIMLYIISEIVANIMYDSLLLYDEPETHLHPNAITELMNTIYELVNQFQSYCLVATHSPLVIRELPSRNVFVVERHENIPSVRRISIESFGENLTTLTDEVFGNRDIPKQYKTIIKDLVYEGRTFEEIIELLQFDETPLSLNARIYIKSMINERT